MSAPAQRRGGRVVQLVGHARAEPAERRQLLALHQRRAALGHLALELLLVLRGHRLGLLALAHVAEERVGADELAVAEPAGGVALDGEHVPVLGDEGDLDVLEGLPLHDLADQQRAVVVVGLLDDVEQREPGQLLGCVAEVLVPRAVDELEVAARVDALDDVVGRLDEVRVEPVALSPALLGLALGRDVPGDGMEVLGLRLLERRPDQPAAAPVAGDEAVLEPAHLAQLATEGQTGLGPGHVVAVDEVDAAGCRRGRSRGVRAARSSLPTVTGSDRRSPSTQARSTARLRRSMATAAGHRASLAVCVVVPHGSSSMDGWSVAACPGATVGSDDRRAGPEAEQETAPDVEVGRRQDHVLEGDVGVARDPLDRVAGVDRRRAGQRVLSAIVAGTFDLTPRSAG